MGNYMMNILPLTFVILLNVSSLNAFNWNNLDSLMPVGSIDFDLKWHKVEKRSLPTDSHAPREIITTIRHDEYSNITLRFVKKHRHRLPSVTTSTGKSESYVVPQSGRQCVWLYEDVRNNAFILVDFCGQIRKLHMIGEVFINGTKHAMLPNGDSYVLYRCIRHQELFRDQVPLYKKQYKHRRRRGQTGDENILELMFYVDDSIYGFFYGLINEAGLTNEQRRQKTIEDIRIFYTYIAQGMNNRYLTITTGGIQIQLKLVSIYIQEVPNELSGETDASSLLNSFTNYVRRQQTNDANFPSVDHYMFITNLDLEYLGDRNSAGFANQGSLCGSPTRATSIVEDNFNFISEVVFSHELGHSLSAFHDGDGNNCGAEEGFIMSAFNLVYSDSRALNMWRFSDCSQQTIADFITDLNSNNNNCMHTLDEPDLDAITTVGPPLGQVYEPDEQCKRMFTSNSELARIYYFETGFEGICTGMRCSTTSISSLALVLPADGTSCGNRKWCQNGQCVSSNNAPPKNETCIFGDQPGEVSPGTTCVQLLSDFSGRCYETNVRVPCCTSCEAQRLTIPGCEFGDRANCSVIQAPNCYGQDVLDDCCKTCNDFIKPGLPESCKYGDKNRACVPASCAANSDICCETCRVEATTVSTNATSSEDKLPDWVIPTAAAVGGFIFVSIIIVIICCVARNKANKNVKEVVRANSKAGRQPKRPELANGKPYPNRVPDNRFSQPSYMRGRPNNLDPRYVGGSASTYAEINYGNMVIGNSRNPAPRSAAIYNTPNRF